MSYIYGMVSAVWQFATHGARGSEPGWKGKTGRAAMKASR